MIRFIRDSGDYKKGMERDLGATLEAALVGSFDAVSIPTPNSRNNDLPVRFDPDTGRFVSAYGDEITPLVSGAGNLARLSGAISARKNGLRTRPPIIFGLGDSNFSGWGAGTGTGTVPKLTGAASMGPMERIKDTVSTIGGLTVRNTAWFGEGNAFGAGAAPVVEYDPRITFGSGWSASSAGGVMFGRLMQQNTGQTGYCSVNLGSAVDTVEVYTFTRVGDSSALGVYNSSNTLIATLDCSPASAAVKFTVSGSFPDGIVKFKNNGGSGYNYLAGVIGWLSTEKAVVVARGSFAGGLVANYVAAPANPWEGLNYFPLIAPDLTVIALTINDIAAPTATNSYTTDLTTIVNAAALQGDVIVSTGGNCDTARWTDGTSLAIEQAASKVAAAAGAPFVSMHRRWGSWAATNALGWEFDDKHRKAPGYLDQGRVYGQIINRLVGG